MCKNFLSRRLGTSHHVTMMHCWNLPNRILLPTMVTFILSAVLLAAFAFRKDQKALNLLFSQKCEDRARTLEIDMSERLRLDSLLGVLFDRDANLHDTVINEFSLKIQTALPGTIGLGWVLPLSEEEHYFAAMSGGSMYQYATLKSAYPFELFKDFTVMDVHSSNTDDSRLATALVTARDNGSTVLSAPFHIPNEASIFIAAIHPVYNRAIDVTVTAGPKESCAHFKGATITMLSVCDVMKFDFRFYPEEPMTVYVSDITGLDQGGVEGREAHNNSLRLLCGISLQEESKPSRPPLQLPVLLREVKTFTLGTRVWQFECLADEEFQHRYDGLGALWIALSLGLMSLLPIGPVLWDSLSINHTQRTKALQGARQDEAMMSVLQCTSQDLRTPIQSLSLSTSQLREELTKTRQNQVLEQQKRKRRRKQQKQRREAPAVGGLKEDVGGATLGRAGTATTTTITLPPPPPRQPINTTAPTTCRSKGSSKGSRNLDIAVATRENRPRQPHPVSGCSGSTDPNAPRSSIQYGPTSPCSPCSPISHGTSSSSSPSSLSNITVLDTMLETLDVITASMLMLDGVVSNVTLSQKLSQDSLEVRLEPEVPLVDLVRSLLQAINLVMGKTGVEMRTDLDPSIPASLSCDPHLLICVLWNLVSNALKWTSKGFVGVGIQRRVWTVGGGEAEEGAKEKEEAGDETAEEGVRGRGGGGEEKDEGGGVEDMEVHTQPAGVPEHRKAGGAGDGDGEDGGGGDAAKPGAGPGTGSGTGREAGTGDGGTRLRRRVRVTFSVTDTGKGMSDEEKARCCEPYERTIREFGGGCGLGLSICKRAIELLGGELCVQSTLGKGSRFSFTVNLEVPPSGGGSGGGNTPLRGDLRNTDEAGGAETGSRGPGRMRGDLDPELAGLGGGVKLGVRSEGSTMGTPPLQYRSVAHPVIPRLNLLFIEDNKVNLKLGVRMLVRAGHRVTPAVDGLQGLELMCGGATGQEASEEVEGGRCDEADAPDSRRGSACEFDAVLTDIEMPKMCGDVMVKLYREWEAVHRPGFHLPICALTGQVGVQQWQEYSRVGVDLVVAKPYTKVDVIGFLHTFCCGDGEEGEGTIGSCTAWTM